MNLRDEILEKSGINEMALADLKGIDLENASAEEVASSYIKAAKGRGMDDKKIIAGLGATFRAVGGPDSDKKTKMTASVEDVKAAVKKELGFESKASAAARKKAEKEAEQSDKEREDLKKAMGKGEPTEENVIVNDILKKAGVIQEGKMYSMNTKMYGKMTSKDGDKFYSKDGTKMYCKSTDKMYSKATDGKMKMMSKDTEFKCKYCGEKFDTEKKLEKHMKMCKA